MDANVCDKDHNPTNYYLTVTTRIVFDRAAEENAGHRSDVCPAAEGARPHHPADAARPRRRGDRVSAPAASWCDPAGESPAQVGSSVRLVASVAWPLATVVAKRTQQLHGVWDRATKDETSQGPRVFIRSKATCAAPL